MSNSFKLDWSLESWRKIPEVRIVELLTTPIGPRDAVLKVFALDWYEVLECEARSGGYETYEVYVNKKSILARILVGPDRPRMLNRGQFCRGMENLNQT